MIKIHEPFPIESIEEERLKIQDQLDTAKTPAERNRLGQFATPSSLAKEIVDGSLAFVADCPSLRFLDPAFGTGSFYAALISSVGHSIIDWAWGYEIDPHYGIPAQKLWASDGLLLEIADFTQVRPPEAEREKANLLICNPPYSRHHHLCPDSKQRLQTLTAQLTGIRPNGLAGLYAYFLLLSHGWLADGGVACWLIPSEFMDVNYGQQVKEYLTRHVTLLRVHLFDPRDRQFGDALVSSSVVWFRKEKPKADHVVEFSRDGSLSHPRRSKRVPLSQFQPENKWTKIPQMFGTKASEFSTNPTALKLKDLFEIKRGVATGANDFFILTPDRIAKHQLPPEFLTPILPSPRYLSADEIEADEQNHPMIDRLRFLLNCDLPESVIRARYVPLWEYLLRGIEKGINRRYLCKHRRPWYAQETRSPTPLLCTYMGRQSKSSHKPFRFILNHSKAIAANVYLMLYPKPVLENLLQTEPQSIRRIWQGLNQIPPETLIHQGRAYGDGLHKLEPKELANAPATPVLSTLPRLGFTCLDPATSDDCPPDADFRR